MAESRPQRSCASAGTPNGALELELASGIRDRLEGNKGDSKHFMLAFPPDFTFVIQLVSFFVLLVVLNRLLFVPFTELLTERQQRTEGATAEAAAQQLEVAQLASKLESELASARSAASAEAERIRREARAEESSLFEQAGEEAAGRLAELRAGIEREREEAASQLRGDADGLANQMVQAVLGGTRRA